MNHPINQSINHATTHCLLLFALGVFGVSFLADLPSGWFWLSVIPVAILPIIRWRDYRFLCLCLGIAWGTWCGHQLLSQQLPESMELQEFLVQGSLSGLPQSNQRRSRFQLQVDSCTGLQSNKQLPLQKLQLSWYGERPALAVGQRWQLRVKLRRPRGFANPGGFDYHHWLQQQGVSATGYVRKSADNRLLGQKLNWLQAQRHRLHRQIEQMPLPELQRGLLQALIVGEGSSLDTDQWGLFNRTGTTHLMVISGLHIG
ncbi:MAG: ComEC/Rec2 family competence protein, partial [Porticoccaceae bacterium]|nr:ComEC/Rec2 family competence protein [Porticoccaceae bacterium]